MLFRSFRAHSTTGILRNIAGLHRLSTGAEVNATIHPQRPDNHHVRAAIGPSGRDPILPVFFEAVLGPFPGQQALVAFRKPIARNVGRVVFGELFFSFGMCSFSNQKLELQRGPTSPRKLLHLLNSRGCAVFIST